MVVSLVPHNKEVIKVKEFNQIIAAVIFAFALIASAVIISNAIVSAGGDIGSQIASAINQIN